MISLLQIKRPQGGSPRSSGRGAGISACQGTSLRLATRPWALSTGDYGGSRPPAKPGAPAAVARTAPARLPGESPFIIVKNSPARWRCSFPLRFPTIWRQPIIVQSGRGTRSGGNRRYWFPGACSNPQIAIVSETCRANGLADERNGARVSDDGQDSRAESHNLRGGESRIFGARGGEGPAAISREVGGGAVQKRTSGRGPALRR